MAVFLGADFVVFLALFATYIYLRIQSPTWPAFFHFASGLMAFAITLFALSSSWVMYHSVRYQLKQGYDISMRLILAAIAVLGCVVIMLGMEWVRLIFLLDVTFTNHWTYFALTGFYLLHLFGGLIYLSVVAAKIKTMDVGAAALFVHFTNLVWLILLFGVYFASADLQGI